MDQTTLDTFKTLLHDQKRALLAQANHTVNQETSTVKEHLSDYADLATQESDQAFQLRIRDRERKLIKKIDQALERIDEGTFGLCECCGEEIGAERLKARPVTTFCIECKTKMEERELE